MNKSRKNLSGERHFTALQWGPIFNAIEKLSAPSFACNCDKHRQVFRIVSPQYWMATLAWSPATSGGIIEGIRSISPEIIFILSSPTTSQRTSDKKERVFPRLFLAATTGDRPRRRTDHQPVRSSQAAASSTCRNWKVVIWNEMDFPMLITNVPKLIGQQKSYCAQG